MSEGRVDVTIFISLARLAERVIAVERLVAQLRQIINDLGEQQFNNALAALDDALISTDPRHELTNAINHLQDTVSLSRQAYKKAEAASSPWWKIQTSPTFNSPRYEAGKRTCTALAIITAIYASMGERKLALRYAEELRNEVDKAYPSEFRLTAFIHWMSRSARDRLGSDGYNQVVNATGGPSRGLSYWFGTGRSDDPDVKPLDEVFSFFDSVNELLVKAGASPHTPQLQVRVTEQLQSFAYGAKETRPEPRKFVFMVSSERDLIAQYKATGPLDW